MIALAFILGGVVLVLGTVVVFSREAARRAVERESATLADSFAREARAAAERKAAALADNAVNTVKEASNEELQRIARDLARGK